MYIFLEEPTLPFETVVKKSINYSRPVIVVGIYKDKINDHLISEYPEEFGSCVPRNVHNLLTISLIIFIIIHFVIM